MNHIFISYSHKDKEYVEKLEKKLIKEGFNVWIDHDIDYGSRWTKAIEQALDSCAAYIVVMSKKSNESVWVHREVIHAEKRKKPFFPLLLDGETWFSLADIQYEDVSDGSLPDEKFYERIASVVTRTKEESRFEPPKKQFKMDSKLAAGLIGGVLIFIAVALNWQNIRELTIQPTSEPTKASAPKSTDEPVPLTNTPPPTTEVPPTTVSPGIEQPTTKKRPADGMTMIYIPAGEFEMGTEDYYDEEPIHMVSLDAFWIDQTEITNSMFRNFVDKTGYVTDAEEARESWTYVEASWEPTRNANWSQPDGPGSNINRKGNHPVVHISWNDARAYCQWVGGRLLTEAEWEKAARSDDGRKYPWGNTPASTEFLNFDLNIKDTVVVGNYEKGRSPYGLYDMAGNVWEWVSDWYSSDYYQDSPSKNPVGPAPTEDHVTRGGSWDDNAENVTAATRGHLPPERTSSSIGFRCGATP